jgi:hypothetical protein
MMEDFGCEEMTAIEREGSILGLCFFHEGLRSSLLSPVGGTVLFFWWQNIISYNYPPIESTTEFSDW